MSGLAIKPIRFHLKQLLIDDLESLEDFQINKPLSLAVEALKVDSSTISILLRLKLKLEEGLGLIAAYAVDFRVSQEGNADFEITDQDLASPFVNINAPAIAYPYLRAYISTICVNSGFKPFLLPTVNFQALYNERKKDSQAPNESRPSINIE